MRDEEESVMDVLSVWLSVFAVEEERMKENHNAY